MYYHSMSSYVANAPIAIEACLLEATSECFLGLLRTTLYVKMGTVDGKILALLSAITFCQK